MSSVCVYRNKRAVCLERRVVCESYGAVNPGFMLLPPLVPKWVIIIIIIVIIIIIIYFETRFHIAILALDSL